MFGCRLVVVVVERLEAVSVSVRLWTWMCRRVVGKGRRGVGLWCC